MGDGLKQAATEQLVKNACGNWDDEEEKEMQKLLMKFKMRLKGILTHESEKRQQR